MSPELLAKKSIVVISSLTTFSTAAYLISAFKKNGHSVFVISDTPHSESNLMRSGAFNLPIVLKKYGISPDLVLFIEGGSMQIFPGGLEQIPCMCAWYGIDTHMDYEKHLKICRVFDVSFIAQLEYVGKLRLDGINQVYWLPLAYDHGFMPNSVLERSIDVAYVGSMQQQMNPERHDLIERLKKEFPNHYFGNANPADMERIYSNSRIVFNRSVRNDVNMRFFEAMGSGAVLLSNEIINNGVDQLFENGIHYLTYQDEESLVILVKELLRDPARCGTISETARTHILNQHTYSHRSNEIIKIVDVDSEKKKILPEFIVSALVTQGFISEAVIEISGLIKQQSLTGSAKWLAILMASAIKMLAYAMGCAEQLKSKLRK
jgi:hypothetical protein